MSFSTNKNKELLWNTLIEVGAFNNIKEEKLTQVKQTFSNMHTSLISSENKMSLIDLNKQFTLTMVKYLSTLKEKPIIKQVYASEQPPNPPQKPNPNPNLTLKYKNTFDKKQPQKVSFKDEELDAPIKNIDDLMLKMQKERNLELPSKQDIKKAEQWLNANKQSNNLIEPTNPTINKPDNNTNNIISHENPTINTETNHFLNKLKKEPTIEERLSAIEKDILSIKKKLGI
uniref:Uncharacterized protein n=1 Tax=Megaviridae environmental sample TaxID=1737588 RepID=A0A5J6VKU8_9VIRU|nr:MAG: hypothetical protein [Megaviridae environmental sample]